MSLYTEWVKTAYDNRGQNNKSFWNKYLPSEQKIYEEFLEGGGKEIRGTVLELSGRFNMPVSWIIGFMDGIKEAAFTDDFDIESVTEETEVIINPPLDKLYKLMVEYKASHLYSLPAWDKIFSKEEQKEMFSEQKRSKTVVKEEKTGRNDPCPCGSGKKYKKCCGAAL